MHHTTLLLSLLAVPTATQAPAQDPPQLHAREVHAYRTLRAWLRPQNGGVAVRGLGTAAGYEATVLAEAGEGRTERLERTPPERTFAVVLWPRADDPTPGRLLFGNRAGIVLLGTPREPLATGFRPEAELIAAPGGPARVNQMLLQDGPSQDGTQWQRSEITPAPARIEVIDADGAPLAGARIEMGAPRLPWHPGWVSVAHVATAAIDGATDERGTLQGDGLPARELWLSLWVEDRQAVLLPDDVRRADGTLQVRVPRGALVDGKALQDQAWAAEALRRFAEGQERLRAQAKLDRDGDGRGEYGLAYDAIPVQQWSDLRPAGVPHQFAFRSHLLQAWLPAGDGWISGVAVEPATAARVKAAPTTADADGAELRFRALAWPAQPGQPQARAFRVDESGVVRWRFVGDEQCGHQGAPGAEGWADGAVWHALRR